MTNKQTYNVSTYQYNDNNYKVVTTYVNHNGEFIVMLSQCLTCIELKHMCESCSRHIELPF